MNITISCACCGKKLHDLDDNRCSCGLIVCVACCFTYDHWLQGMHATPGGLHQPQAIRP